MYLTASRLRTLCLREALQRCWHRLSWAKSVDVPWFSNMRMTYVLFGSFSLAVLSVMSSAHGWRVCAELAHALPRGASMLSLRTPCPVERPCWACVLSPVDSQCWACAHPAPWRDPGASGFVWSPWAYWSKWVLIHSMVILCLLRCQFHRGQNILEYNM